MDVCPHDGAALNDVSELPIGAVLGGYKIVGELGDGGMGFVYEVTHEVLGRRCAMKLLRPEFSENHQVVTRFLQEAKAVNLISNKHIVDVYDYGDDVDGIVYFVMEYLEGDTLDGLMRKYAPMPTALFTHVFSQALQGLAAAHDNNIVHRDLKFENVYFIKRSNNPIFIKLLDFGVAKLRGDHAVEGLTTEGQLIGTPKFMSPEQFRGQAVDARSDVFSLGIMMYAAATARMPFPGTELSELAVGIIKDIQQPAIERVPSIPQGLSDFIDKALKKDPEERFANAGEMQIALLKIRDELDPDSEDIKAFLREHLGDPNADVGLAVVTPLPPDETAPEKRAPKKSSSKSSGGKSSAKLGIGIAAAVALAGGLGFVLMGGDGDKKDTTAAKKAGGTSGTSTASPPEAAELTLEQSLEGPGAKTRSIASEAMVSLWNESDAATRQLFVPALAQVGSAATEPLLILALQEEPPGAVQAAAALAEHKSDASGEALFAALEGAGPQLRIAVATTLLAAQDARAQKVLKGLLKKPRHKTVAALALVRHRADPASIQILRDVFVETPPWKGKWLDAAVGLLITGDADAQTALLAGLESESAPNRARAAAALAMAGNETGKEFLGNLVADARADGREEAAIVLAKLGHPDAKLFVPVGLMSDVEASQIAAIGILSRLGGEELRKQAKRLAGLANGDAPALSMAAMAALANCPD